MNIYSGTWKRLLLRLVLAAPLLFWGVWVMVGVGGGLAEGFADCLFGVAFLILGAIVLAGPLAELAANLTMKGVSSLLFPDRYFTRPQPNYSIPEARVKAGCYREAMALYEKLAAEHPNEVRVYVEMMDLASVHLHDSARAAAIFQRGLAAVKELEAHGALLHAGEAILSRLAPDPEWRRRRRLQPPTIDPARPRSGGFARPAKRPSEKGGRMP